VSVRPSTRHPSFGHGSTAAGVILSYKNSLDFWPTITKQHFSSFIGQRSTTRPPKKYIRTLTYGLCVCVCVCGVDPHIFVFFLSPEIFQSSRNSGAEISTLPFCFIFYNHIFTLLLWTWLFGIFPRLSGSLFFNNNRGDRPLPFSRNRNVDIWMYGCTGRPL
jgi:hypothetical protein